MFFWKYSVHDQRFETEILKYLKKGERQKNPFISGNFPIWTFSGFFSFLFSVIPLHEPYSSCCVLPQNGQRFEIEASQAPKGNLVKDRHHEKYYFLTVWVYGSGKIAKGEMIIKHFNWAGQVFCTCGRILYFLPFHLYRRWWSVPWFRKILLVKAFTSGFNFPFNLNLAEVASSSPQQLQWGNNGYLEIIIILHFFLKCHLHHFCCSCFVSLKSFISHSPSPSVSASMFSSLCHFCLTHPQFQPQGVFFES